MLAMVVNDDEGCLDARGVWATIASMLAPTGDGAVELIDLAFHTISAGLLRRVDTGVGAQ